MQARNDFSWLLLRLGPVRWQIVLGLAGVTVAGLAAALDPLLMRALIDGAPPQRNARWALELAGAIGRCDFGRSALSAIASLVNFVIAQHCVRDLRVALLDQINWLSVDSHSESEHSGDSVPCAYHTTITSLSENSNAPHGIDPISSSSL